MVTIENLHKKKGQGSYSANRNIVGQEHFAKGNFSDFGPQAIACRKE